MFFEAASAKLEAARLRLTKERPNEDITAFLTQAFTLASLQTMDELTKAFSEEDRLAYKDFFAQLDDAQTSDGLTPLLRKYGVTEELTLKIFGEKLEVVLALK